MFGCLGNKHNDYHVYMSFYTLYRTSKFTTFTGSIKTAAETDTLCETTTLQPNALVKTFPLLKKCNSKYSQYI